MAQKFLESLMPNSQKANTTRNSTKTQLSSPQWGKASWWKALGLSMVDSILSLPKSLPKKVTVLAIAISVIPVATVGGIAYTLASRSITAQIFAEQESRILGLRSGFKTTINRFVEDAEAISKSPLLTSSQQSNTTISESLFPENSLSSTKTSVEQKISLLDSFIQASNGRYDSIAVVDPTGKLLFGSHSSRPFSPDEDYNHQEYFQRAIATHSPAINNPSTTLSTHTTHLQVAAPIKHVETGEILGVVLVQMGEVYARQMWTGFSQGETRYAFIKNTRRLSLP